MQIKSKKCVKKDIVACAWNRIANIFISSILITYGKKGLLWIIAYSDLGIYIHFYNLGAIWNTICGILSKKFSK